MAFFCSGGERAPPDLINETYAVAMSLARQAANVNVEPATPSQAKAIKGLQKEALALIAKVKDSKEPSPSYKKIEALPEKKLKEILGNMKRIQAGLVDSGCPTRASSRDMKTLAGSVQRLKAQVTQLDAYVKSHASELSIGKTREIREVIANVTTQLGIEGEDSAKETYAAIEKLGEDEVQDLQEIATGYLEETSRLINDMSRFAKIVPRSRQPKSRSITIIAPGAPPLTPGMLQRSRQESAAGDASNEPSPPLHRHRSLSETRSPTPEEDEGPPLPGEVPRR